MSNVHSKIFLIVAFLFASGCNPPGLASFNLRESAVTRDDPMPPIGYKFYAYILPQPQFQKTSLLEIQKYAGCMAKVGAGDDPSQTVIMVVPEQRSPGQIDTQLAHDLARLFYNSPDIDGSELYVLIRSTPLSIGKRVTAEDTVAIRLGRIAPQYVGQWLYQLQIGLEAGNIQKPDDIKLQIMSALATIGGLQDFIGVAHASVAPDLATACSN
jgi:hypothetical protein